MGCGFSKTGRGVTVDNLKNNISNGFLIGGKVLNNEVNNSMGSNSSKRKLNNKDQQAAAENPGVGDSIKDNNNPTSASKSSTFLQLNT